MTWFKLPVAASVAATTMRAASTVEATTAPMESAATVEGASATGPAATMEGTSAAVPASGIAANRTAPIGIAWAIAVTSPVAAISATIAVSTATVGPARPAIIAVTPAVIPRARADKHAAYEVVRPIVAVRRAIVRVIPVVAISANRRGANPGVHRANSNAHPDLRLRVIRAHQ
jgi:hypothetical protein